MVFWTDLWHPMGRLIEVIDERRTHKLGIARRAMIAEVLVDQQWRFQQTRDRSIERVLTRVKEFQVTLVQNAEDIVTWKSGKEEFKRFFSAFQHLEHDLYAIRYSALV